MSAELVTSRCPHWCRDDVGHEWAHTTAIGIIGLMSVSRVRAHQKDSDPLGKLWPHEAVEVSVEDEHGDSEQRIVCTPEQARSLAAALTRTADLMEHGPRSA